jgi:hypothetical protein
MPIGAAQIDQEANSRRFQFCPKFLDAPNWFRRDSTANLGRNLSFDSMLSHRAVPVVQSFVTPLISKS